MGITTAEPAVVSACRTTDCAVVIQCQ